MQIFGKRTAWALLTGLVVTTAAGCDSFLDVNENPNAPENARIDLRLPAMIAAFSHAVYYGETQLWGSEWTQQFSYNASLGRTPRCIVTSFRIRTAIPRGTISTRVR